MTRQSRITSSGGTTNPSNLVPESVNHYVRVTEVPHGRMKGVKSSKSPSERKEEGTNNWQYIHMEQKSPASNKMQKPDCTQQLAYIPTAWHGGKRQGAKLFVLHDTVFMIYYQ